MTDVVSDPTIQYTTVCGVTLPEISLNKIYPLVLYKVTPEWEDFLRLETPTAVTDDKFTDEDFLKKIANACASMYNAHGVGLAANQIGFKENWCIIDTSGENKPRVMINPELVEASYVNEFIPQHEGCLSVPLGFKGDVPRPTYARVTYTNMRGEEEVWAAKDLEAQAVMHELDHLQGRLFIDYLSNLRRSFFEKKIQKAIKLARIRIKKHNKDLLRQVDDINMKYTWSTQRKTDELEKNEQVSGE